MFKRLLNHFSWSDWQRIGEQVDTYRKCRYEVFRSSNKNGLNRYKKILIVKASCHASEARILEGSNG